MMSEKRVQDLEQDMAVMKSIVPPLMDKMDKATEAQIMLTHEIKNLVESNRRSESKIEEHEKRIYSLEAKDLVRQSGDQVILWVKRGFILAVVSALTSLILIKV